MRDGPQIHIQLYMMAIQIPGVLLVIVLQHMVFILLFNIMVLQKQGIILVVGIYIMQDTQEHIVKDKDMVIGIKQQIMQHTRNGPLQHIQLHIMAIKIPVVLLVIVQLPMIVLLLFKIMVLHEQGIILVVGIYMKGVHIQEHMVQDKDMVIGIKH